MGFALDAAIQFLALARERREVRVGAQAGSGEGEQGAEKADFHPRENAAGRKFGEPRDCLARAVALNAAMPSRPIPGSSGEVLTSLPSAYLPHGATGLLHLPRFLAKAKYTKEHGKLPPSYAKNYKRGMDRFLCLHLGIDPAAVEQIVFAAATDAEIDAQLLALFPADVRAAKWNRDYVQKGMTPSGREFLKEALTNMGCADRVEQIISVVNLIEFDEGRIE